MQFRTKIFIGSVVAAIVSLVASELWLARQVREERLTALVGHLTAEANLIAHSLETSRPDVDLDRVAHDVGRVSSSRVTLIAPDGNVLGIPRSRRRSAPASTITPPALKWCRRGTMASARCGVTATP